MNISKFTELLNEKAKEIKPEKNSILLSEVEHIIRKLLEKYERNIYVTEYAGTIKINSGYDSPTTIYISLKRKIVDKKYEIYFGTTTYYKIVEVIVEYDYNSYKTFEGFINYNKKCREKKEKADENRVKKFEKRLQEEGIDFIKLMELMKEYRNLPYFPKQKLAHKYAGEDYFKYL